MGQIRLPTDSQPQLKLYSRAQLSQRIFRFDSRLTLGIFMKSLPASGKLTIRMWKVR